MGWRLVAVAGLLVLAGQFASSQETGNVETYLKRTFGSWAHAGAGISAGLAQWKGYPDEWGQGGDGFGKRFAAAYSRKVVKNSVDLGVSSLHGEMMAYQRCLCEGLWSRTGYALKRTFVRESAHGGTTFAFGRVAGAYGAGFATNLWYPPARSGVGDALRRGTLFLGFDAGKSVLHEFWPDIKRKLLRR